MSNMDNHEVNMHLLRDRALKLPEVTEELWKEVNEESRFLVEEYLEINKGTLSPASLKQYTSGLRQFFYWVHTALNSKSIVKVTKRDFLRYISYLTNRGMSSSGIKFKKACVSSFNNYIENIVADDDETYKTFRNFTRGLPAIPKNQVYEKVKISKEDYELMIKTLLEDENYMAVAWVATAFNTGARRGEIRQFKSEIVNYSIKKGQNYVLSHNVRGKGRSTQGKIIQYMINTEALKYINLWLEKRGYESDYIFTVKYGGEIREISLDWANYLCDEVLSDILGRRINPHLFKASCVTYLLETGVDMKLVSQFVAHHEDISTTSAHYDLRNFENEKNNIFNGMSFNTELDDEDID